ncbi:MAG: hypothetical protein IKP22_03855 [Clostridia bacterium]|nr:hypothetical protein [Clostridia bacterium]
MKKILAVLAALCVMALPIAGLAEEAVTEAPAEATHAEYAFGNIQLSLNGQPLDFSGLEIDGSFTADPSGSVLESTQLFVGEQMALGADTLMDSGVLTIALRGVDGVYLIPALSLNVNEIMEQYMAQAGGMDIEAMINQYMGKAMSVIGAVMVRLNELEPETSVWTDYRFCDDVVSDVAVTIYTLDSDTLNAIAADVVTALEISSPVSFDGVTLKVVAGSTQEGRTVISLIIGNAEEYYSADIQVFASEGGQTIYAAAYKGDDLAGDAVAVYSFLENVFSANLAVNIPGTALAIILTGTPEENSFKGQFQCSLASGENTLDFSSDLYFGLEEGGLIDASDLTALETVDLMTLTQDQEAANALTQKLMPSLMEGVALLQQVPAINMLLQSFLPSGEAVAE